LKVESRPIHVSLVQYWRGGGSTNWQTQRIPRLSLLQIAFVNPLKADGRVESGDGSEESKLLWRMEKLGLEEDSEEVAEDLGGCDRVGSEARSAIGRRSRRRQGMVGRLNGTYRLPWKSCQKNKDISGSDDTRSDLEETRVRTKINIEKANELSKSTCQSFEMLTRPPL
jgi:hypothetical protein